MNELNFEVMTTYNVFKYESKCGTIKVATLSKSHIDGFTAIDCNTMEIVKVVRENGFFTYNGVRVYQCEYEPVVQVSLKMPTTFCLATSIMKGEVELFFDEHYEGL